MSWELHDLQKNLMGLLIAASLLLTLIVFWILSWFSTVKKLLAQQQQELIKIRQILEEQTELQRKQDERDGGLFLQKD